MARGAQILDLLQPLEAIRMDISSILSVLQNQTASLGRGSPRAAPRAPIRAAARKFGQTFQTAFRQFQARIKQDIPALGKLQTQHLKQLKQRLGTITQQTFSRKTARNRRFIDDMSKKFGIQITDQVYKQMRKAIQSKSGPSQKLFKILSLKFQDSFQNGLAKFKFGPFVKQFSQSVSSGVKSSMSKRLSFLPDFIRKPLVKGFSGLVDNYGKSFQQAVTNSKRLQKVFQVLAPLIKGSRVRLIALGLTIGLIARMFKSVQDAWTEVNRQFGTMVMSFKQFATTAFDFSMKTGQSMKEFKQSVIAVTKQFGFLDKSAVQTGALLSRVFGVSRDQRAQVQRIIGGPGHSIQATLDQVTRSVIKLGGHGKKVFKDIIALSDKWRASTEDQRKQFIDLSSRLSSIGVTGGDVMKSMTRGFESIDTALQTTKKMNLRMLQIGINAGKNYNLFKATRAIDIYKAMRVGDVQKAFDILNKQLGTDFVKDFDKIKSSARKRRLLQTMFGSVQAGQKIMDQARNMLDTFGTTDMKKLQDRVQSRLSLDPQKNKDLIRGITKQLQKMRMDSNEDVRKNRKKIFQGGERQLLYKIKAEVQTKVTDIKTFQDMAEATKTLGMRLSQMWEAFKAGFLKVLLPTIVAINNRLGGFRTTDLAFFRMLGQGLGILIVALVRLVGVVWLMYKAVKMLPGVFLTLGAWFSRIGAWFMQFGGVIGRLFKFIRPFARLRGKLFLPISLILAFFDSLGTYFDRSRQMGDGFLGFLKRLVLAFSAIMDALISPFKMVYDFIVDIIAKLRGFDPANWHMGSFVETLFGTKGSGRKEGDYVKATRGGVQRTVGQGGQDQVISPIKPLQNMADRRAARADNSKLQSLMEANNKLVSKLIEAISGSKQITGTLKLDGDMAQMVNAQLRYRNNK